MKKKILIQYTCSQYEDAPKGSGEYFEAGARLIKVVAHRSQVDNSVKHIGELLFGVDFGSEVLQNVRPAGQPLVDNWDCLKSYVSNSPYYKYPCGMVPNVISSSFIFHVYIGREI